ncbi:creatininase family protein [Micromonospora yasonensis]|uniref:creatininase family protein n=1 Tax=Micromonospora yasonensis TaxID=1128667 RepID=UPI00223163CE|nr:creatininase family protein [Micromonospora yasonensis]MCW3844125.1 creatininase family protein [Micromonospora yasonensis]
MASAVRWAETDRQTLTDQLPEAIVLLPVGATEQHGPHLPTGTDALIADSVCTAAADQAADRCRRPLLVAPAIPVGASDHHLPFGGTLSLTPETLSAVLLDLARSIAVQGGRRLIVVNGHGGNVGVCHSAAAAASTRYDLAVGHVDYWRAADAEPQVPVPGHAGEFETSLVLALRPHLVRDAVPRPRSPQPPTVAGVDLHSGAVWQAIDGYTDRPEVADAATGKRRFDQMVASLADRIVGVARVL